MDVSKLDADLQRTILAAREQNPELSVSEAMKAYENKRQGGKLSDKAQEGEVLAEAGSAMLVQKSVQKEIARLNNVTVAERIVEFAQKMGEEIKRLLGAGDFTGEEYNMLKDQADTMRKMEAAYRAMLLEANQNARKQMDTTDGNAVQNADSVVQFSGRGNGKKNKTDITDTSTSSIRSNSIHRFGRDQNDQAAKRALNVSPGNLRELGLTDNVSITDEKVNTCISGLAKIHAQIRQSFEHFSSQKNDSKKRMPKDRVNVNEFLYQLKYLAGFKASNTNSYYIELDNTGKITVSNEINSTLRVSNHPASRSNFESVKENISISITDSTRQMHGIAPNNALTIGIRFSPENFTHNKAMRLVRDIAGYIASVERYTIFGGSFKENADK